MATLFVAAAGAALGVGSGIGAALGISIATTGYGLLYGPRQKPQSRGRIEDAEMRIPSASFGQMIPIVYGQSKVAGNLVWVGAIREKQHTNRVRVSKKRRQTVRDYTYEADFYYIFCEGPAQGIRKIWAEDQIILDTEKDPATIYGITRYLGTHNQSQDPTIISFKGIDRTPAYRHRAGACLKAFPLEDWGNRIPGLYAEIACEGTGEPELPQFFALWRFDALPGPLKDSGSGGYHLTPTLLEPGILELSTDVTGVYGGGIQAMNQLTIEGNGVTAPLQATRFDGTEGFTASFWVKYVFPEDVEPQAFGSAILYAQTLTGDFNTAPAGIRLVVDSWYNGPSVVYFETYISYNYQSPPSGPTSFYPLGFYGIDLGRELPLNSRVWKHVAVSFYPKKDTTPGRWRLYIDGVLVHQVATNVTNAYSFFDNNNGSTGVHFKNTDWSMRVDDAGWAERELTREEILLAMAGRFSEIAP